MSTAAVEFLDVTKILGQQWVLNGISLKVRTGEFLSLLGPSGCGKTTSLRLLAGFDQPTSGEILVNGQSVSGKPPYQRDLNMVFQNYALFPHLTVFRNVAFGLEMQRLRKAEIEERVPEALELVRLAGMEQRYPHQLSGGQQQRVALARALVRRPSVLLLDEPLGALDLRLRKEMQLELKKLQRHLGITFIYVTHDQEEALAMSDRVAVMHQGRIHQLGTPEDIYERPAGRFVADFVGQMNFLTGQVAGVEEGVTLVRKDGMTFRSRRADPEGALPAGQEVTLAIRPEKVHLAAGPLPGMENAFPAVVEEIAYLGTDTQYSVRASEALNLTVRQQNSTVSQALRMGDRVFVCFSAGAVRILED